VTVGSCYVVEVHVTSLLTSIDFSHSKLGHPRHGVAESVCGDGDRLLFEIGE
jgi:hypothetical protein